MPRSQSLFTPSPIIPKHQAHKKSLSLSRRLCATKRRTSNLKTNILRKKKARSRSLSEEGHLPLQSFVYSIIVIPLLGVRASVLLFSSPSSLSFSLARSLVRVAHLSEKIRFPAALQPNSFCLVALLRTPRHTSSPLEVPLRVRSWSLHVVDVFVRVSSLRFGTRFFYGRESEVHKHK